MGTLNFDQLFKDLESGTETVAREAVQQYAGQAKKDGQDAINSMKTNLPRGAAEAETGDLTKNDLEFLLQEESALDEMKALKQAGLAAVQIDKFRNAMINMILGTLTGLIKV